MVERLPYQPDQGLHFLARLMTAFAVRQTIIGLARRADRLPRPEIHCGRFPAVVLDLELDLLTFIERAQSSALDSRDVHEYISAAACRLNKAVAFLRVEPLHRAGRHCRISELTI
jgi:uncharacterized heparinase superfamily protein